MSSSLPDKKGVCSTSSLTPKKHIVEIDKKEPAIEVETPRIHTIRRLWNKISGRNLSPRSSASSPSSSSNFSSFSTAPSQSSKLSRCVSSDHNKVGDFLSSTCPEVVFAIICTFLGPLNPLSLTSTFFNNEVLNNSFLWYMLCFEAGKLKVCGDLGGESCDSVEGRMSYYDIFKAVASVPSDYANIQDAINASPNHGFVVIKPGIYTLDERLHFNVDRVITVVGLKSDPSLPSSSLFMAEAESESETEDEVTIRFPMDHHVSYSSVKQNEPLVHISKGAVTLQNLNLDHYSPGQDMWNGNAAVQIKETESCVTSTAAFLSSFSSTSSSSSSSSFSSINAPQLPSIRILDCRICSSSGRGIVCMSSTCSIMNCSITDCAATGIYVGGSRGSRTTVSEIPHVTISDSDVVRNGFGANSRTGDGDGPNRRPHPFALAAPVDMIITAGHSGVYCEQGSVRLHECNVSNNAYTGIHGVNPVRVTLIIEDCDSINNGGDNVVLPPEGSESGMRTVMDNVQQGSRTESGENTGRVRCDFDFERMKIEEVKKMEFERNGEFVSSDIGPVSVSASFSFDEQEQEQEGVVGVKSRPQDDWDDNSNNDDDDDDDGRGGDSGDSSEWEQVGNESGGVDDA